MEKNVVKKEEKEKKDFRDESLDLARIILLFIRCICSIVKKCK